MDKTPIVVYDACVLYPAPLRDLLMRLAVESLCMARWTSRIHEEWIRNVLKNRPDLTIAQLERTRDLMNAHALDCLVENYEHLIIDLDLPDPHDRHVLAAAIQSNARVIVTFNLKDFPDNHLSEYELEALHPDDFIISLTEVDLTVVINVMKFHRASLKKPPKTLNEYLDILEKQGLLQTVALFKEHEGI